MKTVLITGCSGLVGIHLVNQCLEKGKLKVLDFGDSAGTHCQYIKKLFPFYYDEIQTLSVNIDRKAVEKIRDKGLPALQITEDLNYYSLRFYLFNKKVTFLNVNRESICF